MWRRQINKDDRTDMHFAHLGADRQGKQGTRLFHSSSSSPSSSRWPGETRPDIPSLGGHTAARPTVGGHTAAPSDTQPVRSLVARAHSRDPAQRPPRLPPTTASLAHALLAVLRERAACARSGVVAPNAQTVACRAWRRVRGAAITSPASQCLGAHHDHRHRPQRRRWGQSCALWSDLRQA